MNLLLLNVMCNMKLSWQYKAKLLVLCMLTHGLLVSICFYCYYCLFQEKPDYEYSEMIMYEAQLLKESGQLKEVLKFLDDHESHICDILAMQELKGTPFLMCCLFYLLLLL